MPVFGAYAGLYDALYRDKDYEGECDFLERAFRKHGRVPAKSILDLGCGTGGHLLPLAARGHAVTGVDRSPDMLELARRKAEEKALAVELSQGDVRDLDLGRAFDAVTSMFAVMSYLTAPQDLGRVLSIVANHLRPGGLFVFDVWHGPGVLSDPPVERRKTAEREGQTLVRTARPEVHHSSRTVTVHYTVERFSGGQLLEVVEESHELRFFFPEEIASALAGAGLELMELCPFLRLGEPATPADWTVSVVARA